MLPDWIFAITIVTVTAAFLCSMFGADRAPNITIVVQQNRLNAEQVEHYFPDVRYDELFEGANSAEERECMICLCAFESEDLLKVTYCWHIFHSGCLSSWFKVDQVVEL